MIKKVKYNHQEIEKKWQKEWLKNSTYTPDLKTANKPYFNLMMFPYPSAEGLHVGNMMAFTGADIYGRFQRMNGNSVLEPIGLDGFGIHSENYAIKVGRHPKEHAKVSQENYYNQLRAIGNGFSWEHKLETYDPVYYRWTQWLFIKMWESGLAYKGVAMVNWCPTCKTVLADEQVVDGKCERTGDIVERREMSSWYFRITEYADKLLEGIDTIDWPEKIKTAQRNWIGKSLGRKIKFGISDSSAEVEVFTTKPETILGVTFMAISPEKAQDLLDLIPDINKEKAQEYIKISLNRSEQDRKAGEKEKSGVDTGLFAVNPVNEELIPVWIADYVLSDVGTGAVMGVPFGDARDLEFAKKHGISVIEMEMYKKDIGEPQVRYHLRDWLISRQRYWGPPIPMLNCENCGQVPVPMDQLPVLLPNIDDFKPKGDGTSPLANAPSEWQQTKCPSCGGMAQRELDVSDTFLDSSWYFLAFTHMTNGQWLEGASPFDQELIKKWYPVNTYIGGAEHAVLHLLYARFVWKVLVDQAIVPEKVGYEPFPFLYGHGLIIKDGAKMSKSKGNVVVPDVYINKFGADTLRTYLMFLGPYNQGGDFRDTGIEGMNKFLLRVWGLFSSSGPLNESTPSHREIDIKMHQTIKKVTSDLQTFKYNTAISAIMEYVNALKAQQARISKVNLMVLAQLLAPFAPHMMEEVWTGVLKQEFSIHKSTWPKYKESYLVQEQVIIPIQINGKVRGQITVSSDMLSDKENVFDSAKKDEKIAKWLEGKAVKDIVYVQGKILNILTS